MDQKYRNYILTGIVTLVVAFCSQTGQANDEVKKKIEAGALVVDVRTPAEFSKRHFKTAINIPVTQLKNRLKEFGNKNKPVVVYCAVGGRANTAMQILKQNGYSDVTNAGGLADMPSFE